MITSHVYHQGMGVTQGSFQYLCLVSVYDLICVHAN